MKKKIKIDAIKALKQARELIKDATKLAKEVKGAKESLLGKGDAND